MRSSITGENGGDRHPGRNSDAHGSNVQQSASLMIAQLNMRRAHDVTAEIRTHLLERKIDILLLQEPYTVRCAIPGFGMCNLLATAQCEEGIRPMAGIALFNPNLTALKLNEFCTSHCVCIELKSNVGRFFLVSMYFQYSNDIKESLALLERILQKLRGESILIAADANARSPLWGDCKLDERGMELEDFINQYDLVVLNQSDSPATYSSALGESHIDVTLVTSQMYNLVADWSVKLDWTTSDHRTIVTTLKNETMNSGTPSAHRSNRFDIKRADWEKFHVYLTNISQSSTPDHMSSTQDVERYATKVTKTLVSAAKASIPKKRQFAKSVPWWTPSLTRLRKQVCCLRHKYQKAKKAKADNKEEIYERYRTLRNRYKSLIRSTRTNSWRDFVTECGNETPWSIVYRSAVGKATQKKASSSVRRPDGSQTMSMKETLNCLLKTHFPRDSEEDETPLQSEIRASCFTRTSEGDTPPFTRQDLISALKRQKTRKCPGLDLIETEMLQQGFPAIGNQLLDLYNGCLENGVFPSDWKIAEVKLLLKSPDKDENNPKSYRPISLLPIPGKVFERMIADRLRGIFEHPTYSSDRQYGFRTSRSTVDAISKLKSIVDGDAGESKYVMAMTFDISGAFDNLWIPSILNCLRQRGCPDNILNVLKSYFTNRKVIAKDGYDSVELAVERGCPQGSILGPSCWNLVFDGLLKQLEERGIQALAYADDILVVIHGRSRAVIERAGQEVANILMVWCREQKLTLSVEKSEFILLRGSLQSRPSIRLYGGKPMKMKDSIRYLGVQIGHKFSMLKHVEAIGTRTHNLFSKLGRLARSSWGLTSKVMTIIYQGLFVSIAAYAAPAWADLLNANLRRKLLQVQRQALLKVTKAYRTISTDALCVIAGQVPLDLVVEERSCVYKIRNGIPFSFGDYVFDPSSGTSVEESIRTVKKSIMDKWQERWRTSEKGRTTFAFFADVGVRLKSKWIRLNYHVTQMLSGHGAFRSKLRGFRLVADDRCECGMAETSTHVLFECNLHGNERRDLVESVRRLGHVWPVPESTLVTKQIFPYFKEFCGNVLKKTKV